MKEIFYQMVIDVIIYNNDILITIIIIMLDKVNN